MYAYKIKSKYLHSTRHYVILANGITTHVQ